MSKTVVRERCCSVGCKRTAHVVLKIYTTEKPDFVAFCDRHIEKLIDLIGAMNIQHYSKDSPR